MPRWSCATSPHHMTGPPASKPIDGNVAELVCRRGRRLAAERVIRLRIKHLLADARDRPAIFVAPAARRVLEIRAGRMPVAHVHREARLLEDSGVDPLEPVIEPAHRLVPPFHARIRVGLVRPGVRPGARRSPSPARSSRSRACAGRCRDSRRTSRRCERSGCGCPRSDRAPTRDPRTGRRAGDSCT